MCSLTSANTGITLPRKATFYLENPTFLIHWRASLKHVVYVEVCQVVKLFGRSSGSLNECAIKVVVLGK